jgi:hypothetical protein
MKLSYRKLNQALKLVNGEELLKHTPSESEYILFDTSGILCEYLGVNILHTIDAPPTIKIVVAFDRKGKNLNSALAHLGYNKKVYK